MFVVLESVVHIYVTDECVRKLMYTLRDDDIHLYEIKIHSIYLINIKNGFKYEYAQLCHNIRMAFLTIRVFIGLFLLK